MKENLTRKAINFDLDTNYTEYKKILSNIDNYLKESIKRKVILQK